MIAGLVTVFINEGWQYPFVTDFIGEESRGKQDDRSTLPESRVLKCNRIPSVDRS